MISQGTVPAVAAAGGSGGAVASMWHHLPSGPDRRVSTRVRTMWTGVGATLARDVPFSAIYWQLLEPTRRALLPTDGAASSHSRVRHGRVSWWCYGSLHAPADVHPARWQRQQYVPTTAR